MVAAICDGTEDGVRAGIIGEVGTSTLTEQETKVLRASALASLRTGAAITLHTEYGCREGVRIAQILLSEGVAPDRIILGHMDENLVEYDPQPRLAHLDYHKRVADLGVWVQYDTFGSEWYYDSDGISEPRDTDRVAGLMELIEAGYIDQLLVGQDVWLKQNLRSYGGNGYDHVVRTLPFMLKKAGASGNDVRRIMEENPRRALMLAEA
jgi:phosphotriesterase-related protein